MPSVLIATLSEAVVLLLQQQKRKKLQFAVSSDVITVTDVQTRKRGKGEKDWNGSQMLPYFK